MANVKISDLTAYTDPVATDVLPIVDLVNDQTKKVKVEDLLKKFGTGTEALPSFAFTGDLDTGIYSPGANQFAVSTGGTQRLLIDASGDTTLQGNLTVIGTSTTIESTTLTVDDKNIELGTVSTPSDTTADGGGLTLKGSSDKTLTWVNSTDCWTFNQSLDLPAGSASAPALILNGDVNSGLFQSAADEISVSTGGTQRVVVNSSGNVGINRAAPDNRLSIGSTGSFDEDSNSFYVGSNFTGTGTNFISSNKHAQRLFFNNASSNGYLAYANTGSAGTAGNAITWQERFRITSDGKLGIGESSPQAKLHVKEGNSGVTPDGNRDTLFLEAAGNAGITIGTPNSNTGYLAFGDPEDENAGQIIYRHANNSMSAYTAGTERMVIDSSGNVTLYANLDLQDNDKILLGTGDDLEIYHDGANSYIKEGGTGDLNIQANAFNIKSADGSVTAISYEPDSTHVVKLYYNDSEKLATKSDGVDITGELQSDSLDVDGAANISGELLVDGTGRGTGNVYTIAARKDDGTNGLLMNTSGELWVRDKVKVGTSTASPNINLNSDGSATFAGNVTLSANLDLQDNDKILVGSGDDLQIYHNGSNSIIYNTTGKVLIENHSNDNDIELKTDDGSGNTATYILCDGSSGAVNLNYYGSNKLATKSDGVNITGELECDSLDIDGNIDIHATRISYSTSNEAFKFLDNIKSVYGNGDDLQLYHNGTNSFIDNNAGSLYIRGTGDDLYLRAADDIFIQPQTSENGIKVIGNGAVELYHNNVKTLETTGSGINVKGPEGGETNLELHADEGDDNIDKFRFNVSNSGPFKIQNVASGGWETNIECNGNGNVELYHNDSKKLETTSSGVTVTGAVSDSKGDVRDIPQNSKTAAYTLVAGDAGKHINITTGGVTVPSGVFSIGDAVTIYNDSSSDQTVTQGSSVTLRSAGTADTGNRTLAQRGICTLLCVASNEFVITGAGLS